MIKPEELRIGNWVFDLSRKREVVIWGIESNHERVTLNYANGSGIYDEDLKNIQPIPLTEEWLLKLGFENDKFTKECFHRRYSAQGDLFIFSNKTPVGLANKIESPFYFMFNGLIHCLNTVHQLQNLFHALPGEELQLKN